MKVTQTALTVSLRDVVPALLPRRSPGLHVSQILSAIMAELDPETYDRAYAKADSENWQEMGFLWETILGAALGLHADGAARFRPGEVAKDGIIGSPDGVAFDDQGVVNEEFKATWKSARGFDLDGKKWLYWQLQFKAYAYLLDTLRSRVYVLFINGDYERYVPEIRVYDLAWTRDELEANWAMLVNTAQAKGWL